MPPGDAKGVHADPELPEKPGSAQGEEEEDPACHDDRPARDPSLLRLRTVAGQGQEHRRDPDRVHDHEEGQERAEGELDHRKTQKKTRTATRRTT